MPTPKYLLTTYTSAYNALVTIDSWLVDTMGYTRNLAPTADTVTYTGYKAHYQITFPTGEVLYLNFHTDTAASKLYLTASTGYSSSLAWNAQTGMPTVLSGGIIYSSIAIPTASTNNALYLFGDTKGNCQVFVQRGTTVSASDFMQWGVINKTGYGTWPGGQFFSGWSLEQTTLSAANCGPALAMDSNLGWSPTAAIYITNDGISAWSGVKSFSACNGNTSEPSLTIGTTSQYWSSIITGGCENESINAGSRTLNVFESMGSNGAYVNHPTTLSNIVDDLTLGSVNMTTGKISLGPNQTIYVRHEATTRLSPIGVVPFGYHCPVSGYFLAVVPGTQLVQDGRTFIMMGNIAAEMVSV